MLIRAPIKLILLVVPFLVFGLFVNNRYSSSSSSSSSLRKAAASRLNGFSKSEKVAGVTREAQQEFLAGSKDIGHLPVPPPVLIDVDDDGRAVVDYSQYNEVFSVSTANGDAIRVHFGGVHAYNPSIIPHPTKHDLWIVIAQQAMAEKGEPIIELACNAGFLGDVLTCAESPVPVPLKRRRGPRCKTPHDFNAGLRAVDARVVHGPSAPYILWGSPSSKTCFGVWIQDLRMLLEDYTIESAIASLFREPTELSRPASQEHREQEKNFFLFWDLDNRMYVHHDITPNRTFGVLQMDGTIGEDLAPKTAEADNLCMDRYMPVTSSDNEFVRQASNSLSITLCKREDPGCKPGPDNTFVMHIVHFKYDYGGHPIYEPYVVLFQQQAPFALHSIAKKPLWIHGRDAFTVYSGALGWDNKIYPWRHSESFYVSSISWKTHGQKYHGYLDDELFINLGVENTRPSTIDVVAEDVLRDLGSCADIAPATQTEI
ncbi:hypothetical protein PV08_07810 [Exophiala spinifera]|uniref:Uncharacterized protein n=1 Tax=Exophiala spinifera TaxID=91928 RepID=A0A0D2B834_9EURO|nr:uncharacterized protein PV08_07810 [Exophiala spinifera]KIW15023.1 hypothetical protein PV08_07810 [Exophiala spinifera]